MAVQAEAEQQALSEVVRTLEVELEAARRKREERLREVGVLEVEVAVCNQLIETFERAIEQARAAVSAPRRTRRRRSGSPGAGVPRMKREHWRERLHEALAAAGRPMAETDLAQQFGTSTTTIRRTAESFPEGEIVAQDRLRGGRMVKHYALGERAAEREPATGKPEPLPVP